MAEYRRREIYQASQADTAGTLASKYGDLPYNKGDWLVTDPTNGQTYALEDSSFMAAFEPLTP